METRMMRFQMFTGLLMFAFLGPFVFDHASIV